MIMKQDIIWFRTRFYQLKMDKKFLQEMLLQDYLKRPLKQKISLVVYQELLNYLKQEKLKTVQLLLKMMVK